MIVIDDYIRYFEMYSQTRYYVILLVVISLDVNKKNWIYFETFSIKEIE